MRDAALTHPSATVYLGDCLDVLAEIPDNSVDAIVTDPPYGLGFMGKAWDDLPPGLPWAQECLRVLKPGGHLLAFGGTRTWHRLAVAIEDAGFEVRDSIAWLYGSGFPKSLDVSKAIDKLDAAEERLARAREFQTWLREQITPKRINEITNTDMGHHLTTHPTQPAVATAAIFDQLRPYLPGVPARIEELVRQRTVESENFKARPVTGTVVQPDSSRVRLGFVGETYNGDAAGATREVPITDAHTPAAQQWAGWGTALKPAFEPIVVARKPLVGTVAANVLAHGTGALNIDGTRVGSDGGCRRDTFTDKGDNDVFGVGLDQATPAAAVAGLGRWPTNVVLDDTAAAALDEQSGNRPGSHSQRHDTKSASMFTGCEIGTEQGYGDSGGASRFFPVFPLACSACHHPASHHDGGTCWTDAQGREVYDREACPCIGFESHPTPPFPVFKYQAKAPTRERPVYVAEDGTRTAHPTVKPLALMRWLVRLVTPPGGTVLDTFAGSGATIEAAALEGLTSIGIEREADYLPLIQVRLDRLPTE